ncbi:MAG: low molecular weight protein tyrosine phosphatase family protein [Rhizobiaceae bacterium]
MKNILFVCSANRLRSPTAEQVFAKLDHIEVASAGTNQDAVTPLDGELIEWADIIFVMEKAHRDKLRRNFRKQLKSARVICLNIPDEYQFMEPELVTILERKVSPFLR